MAKKAKRTKAKSAGRAQENQKGGRDIPLATVVAFVQWLQENRHTEDFLETFGKKKVTTQVSLAFITRR